MFCVLEQLLSGDSECMYRGLSYFEFNISMREGLWCLLWYPSTSRHCRLNSSIQPEAELDQWVSERKEGEMRCPTVWLSGDPNYREAEPFSPIRAK
jgi:hypothetical protein